MVFDEIRYACLQCGKSCRQDWDIWLHPRRVQENYLELFVHQDSPFEAAGDGWRVRREAGACAALDAESRCTIHRHKSYQDKPYRCQQYPVLLVRTPDGLRVSASYTCTAVLQQHGPELTTLEAEVREWLDGPYFVNEVGAGLPWEQVRQLESHFEELLAQQGWEPALQRILTGLALGFQEQRSDHPLGWWRHFREVPLNWRQPLPILLSALLKPCLRGRDRQQWQQFDQAMLNGQSVQLDEFGYRGSSEQLLEWAGSPSASSDLERYRRSLWFRKQHLRCGGILSGFLMLWSLGPLYGVLSQLGGSLDALERIELNLLGHNSVAEQIYPLLAEFWLSQSATAFVSCSAEPWSALPAAS